MSYTIDCTFVRRPTSNSFPHLDKTCLLNQKEVSTSECATECYHMDARINPYPFVPSRSTMQ